MTCKKGPVVELNRKARRGIPGIEKIVYKETSVDGARPRQENKDGS